VKRSVRLRPHDMLEAIEDIESTAASMTFAEYEQSWQVRRAVERGVEIISEASRPAMRCGSAHRVTTMSGEFVVCGLRMRPVGWRAFEGNHGGGP
jgi:Ribonuclease HepT-like